MQAKRKIAPEASVEEAPRNASVRAASSADAFQSSPARDLQRSIEAAYYEPVVEPWPAPVRMMILIGGSIGLWSAIGAAIYAALKH